MNQWKVEVNESDCKCALCGEVIREGDRKVVVTYGSTKNFCVSCGVKHMEEKQKLIQAVIAEAEKEEPVFRNFNILGDRTFGWEDQHGNFHVMVEATPDGLMLFRQGEGCPVMTKRQRLVVGHTGERIMYSKETQPS